MSPRVLVITMAAKMSDSRSGAGRQAMRDLAAQLDQTQPGVGYVQALEDCWNEYEGTADQESLDRWNEWYAVNY